MDCVLLTGLVVDVRTPGSGRGGVEGDRGCVASLGRPRDRGCWSGRAILTRRRDTQVANLCHQGVGCGWGPQPRYGHLRPRDTQVTNLCHQRDKTGTQVTNLCHQRDKRDTQVANLCHQGVGCGWGPQPRYGHLRPRDTQVTNLCHQGDKTDTQVANLCHQGQKGHTGCKPVPPGGRGLRLGAATTLRSSQTKGHTGCKPVPPEG